LGKGWTGGGSVTKQHEQTNSFKVYYVEGFGRIYVETYMASSAGGIYILRPAPMVLLD
jgi:hypothetical protein